MTTAKGDDPIEALVRYWAEVGYPQHKKRITFLHRLFRGLAYTLLPVSLVAAFFWQPSYGVVLLPSVVLLLLGMESAFLQCHLGCTIMGACVGTAKSCIAEKPRKVREAKECLVNGIKAMRCTIAPGSRVLTLVTNLVKGVKHEHA
jgi:hypothetical protein